MEKLITELQKQGLSFEQASEAVQMAIDSVRNGTSIWAVITDYLCLSDEYLVELEKLCKKN
jgi:hypothetical protein